MNVKIAMMDDPAMLSLRKRDWRVYYRLVICAEPNQAGKLIVDTRPPLSRPVPPAAFDKAILHLVALGLVKYIESGLYEVLPGD